MNKQILVTGGTGLIGGEVVLSLARTGYAVCALARAADDTQAAKRLQGRLAKSDQYDAGLLGAVEAIAGDTALPHFGIDPERARGVSAIVHCAADTSFRESDSVWQTNVRGATNLVELARRAAPDSRVVFVSTASVATGPTGRVIGEEDGEACHENTYTRSKREAERIVEGSGLDAVIVRPSIVLSRGVHDRSMARSILWAIPIMSEIGQVPVEPGSHVDLVPADFVAHAIAQIATRPKLGFRRYHVSAGDTSETFGDLLEHLGERFPWMQRIRALGARMRTSRAMGPLASYIPFINADVRYSNARLFSELGNFGLPPRASSYLETLFERISLPEAYAEMARP